jgi:hypothetical protein
VKQATIVQALETVQTLLVLKVIIVNLDQMIPHLVLLAHMEHQMA